MKIDSYILFCSKCGFRSFKSKDVTVILNLETNKYEFHVTCQKCGMDIMNTRDFK